MQRKKKAKGKRKQKRKPPSQKNTKRINVTAHMRTTPSGKKKRVKRHTRKIEKISVPHDYTSVKILSDKQLKYCEDGQYYDEGVLLADDVVGPNEATTDDVEELFEGKVGDKFEYIHAQTKKQDAIWKKMSLQKRRSYLRDRGFSTKDAHKSWSGATKEMKRKTSESVWNSMSENERAKFLAKNKLPKSHKKKTWIGLPEEVKMVKGFEVLGVPEKDVPRPAGKCGPPCKDCKL